METLSPETSDSELIHAAPYHVYKGNVQLNRSIWNSIYYGDCITFKNFNLVPKKKYIYIYAKLKNYYKLTASQL